MATYTLNDCFGESITVEVHKASYQTNNHLAVTVTEDGMPYCTLTVNLPESDGLADNEQFVDINNCPFAEEFLVENGLAEPTSLVARSGFCVYPVYRFKF